MRIRLTYQLGLALGLPALVLAAQRPMTNAQMVQQLDSVVNLKQLAYGLNAYAADYDSFYPNVKDINSLKVLIYPYTKTREAFKAHDAKTEIRFNFAVGGVSRRDVKKPTGVVAFYESRPWPDGRRAASFLDGSARLLDAHECAQEALSLLGNFPKKARPLPEAIGKAWKD